jgi:hypothetical protein
MKVEDYMAKCAELGISRGAFEAGGQFPAEPSRMIEQYKAAGVNNRSASKRVAVPAEFMEDFSHLNPVGGRRWPRQRRTPGAG